MSATNLNIRTDKEIKNQAEEIFNELGLNMTTAINMFLRMWFENTAFHLN